ncbi:hypothetical protein AHF37_04882 [Paragonimus kellicotti]|nr:hypothetical protein AHF37_04882 [Paragonimus kellicotti]
MGNSLTCNLDSVMSSTRLLPAVVSASRTAQTATYIFLHGLGDSGHGWSYALKDIVPDYCKLICPHAPSIPVTLNGGMRMPAWYDIYALSSDARQDESGIIEASAQLDKFVQAEIDSGIPADRIVIGGFSQGGSVALYNALTKNRHYGGVTCLSCWLPLHTKLMVDQTLVTVPRDLAVFQCHGTDDCIVPFEMGHATHELLKRFQMSKCEFLTYQNLGHSSNDQEISDLQSFLKKRLPPS